MACIWETVHVQKYWHKDGWLQAASTPGGLSSHKGKQLKSTPSEKRGFFPSSCSWLFELHSVEQCVQESVFTFVVECKFSLRLNNKI